MIDRLLSFCSETMKAHKDHCFGVISAASSAVITTVSGYLERQKENDSRIRSLMQKELTDAGMTSEESRELGLRIAAVATYIFTTAPMIASWLVLGWPHALLSLHILAFLGLALADDITKLAPSSSNGIKDTYFIKGAIDCCGIAQSIFRRISPCS